MMMRRRDLSGEKEWRGTMLERWVRIVASDAGWNTERSSRLVIRSVFEGGAGVLRGGMEERSIENGVRGNRGERAGEDVVGEGEEWRLWGELAIASMENDVCWRFWWCWDGMGWWSLWRRGLFKTAWDV